jgi:hypothetical protein
MNDDEKLYQEILDQFAKKQWNPKTHRNDLNGWNELKEIYVKGSASWKAWIEDIERVTKFAVNKTRAETAKQIFEELDLNSTQDNANFVKKDYEDYQALKKKFIDD